MKKTFIAANWKSNMTNLEVKSWLGGFNVQDLKFIDKKIVICPPFTLLPALNSLIAKNKLPIYLGSQNISPLDEGAYTGEINGKQIKEFAEFVIVGHSERRKNFFESEEMVNLKISQAFKYGLMPIICVSDLEQVKTLQERVRGKFQFNVAYEPLFAIGSGIVDTPENANRMAKKIKDILGGIPVLYGGSVTSNNINAFTKMSDINGVLVGKASLDPLEFLQIIKNA